MSTKLELRLRELELRLDAMESYLALGELSDSELRDLKTLGANEMFKRRGWQSDEDREKDYRRFTYWAIRLGIPQR